MNYERLDASHQEIIEKSLSIMKRKREQYTVDMCSSPYGNFGEIANIYDMTPQTVIGILMEKHLQALRDNFYNLKINEELLDERIADIFNYLVILKEVILTYKELYDSPI